MSQDIDPAEMPLFDQSEVCGGGWVVLYNPILVIGFSQAKNQAEQQGD